MMCMAEQHAADRRGSEAEAVVSTALGDLRGIARNGVRVFRGIRYAQAPIGALRFRPPEPVSAWRGVADATAFGPVPFQPYDPSVDHGTQDMSEDCLSLNIWAPARPGPHPVLVWIHGGGQTVGSTRRLEYEGSRFAENGVVCVTVGYRLGALGFLELGALAGPDYRGSGNNAIRDLLLALQWVNLHIGAFGGDPAHVTLGGESAGAKNAVTLTGVPGARGLFHRLVVCSGGAHTMHRPSEAEDVARLLRAEAGLPADQGHRLLQLPAADLLAAQESAVRRWSRKFAFRPVIDGSLIPAPVLDQIAAGTAPTLPTLIGTARDECAAFIVAADEGLAPDARELAHVGPAAFMAVERRHAQMLPRLSSTERRLRTLTAEEYGIPSVRLADALCERGGAVWMYRFSGLPDGAGGVPATHVADLPLWWGHRPGSLKPSSAAVATADAMHAALCAFVRGENLEVSVAGIRWPRYGTVRRAVLSWGRAVGVQFDPAGVERALWDDVL